MSVAEDGYNIYALHSVKFWFDKRRFFFFMKPDSVFLKSIEGAKIALFKECRLAPVKFPFNE